MVKRISSCGVCGTPFASGRMEGLCVVCLMDASGEDSLLEEPYARSGAKFHPEQPEGFPGAGRSLLTVPGYRVLREIARGGMGIVYEAEQNNPVRKVALKMLLPHLMEMPEMRERFRREAQAMARLEHAGVLPVHEVGDHLGTPYFSMKLATGGTLLEKRPELEGKWREIAALVVELAEAVRCAHEHGILHRDLKPGNVLLDDAGRAYVTDFGLAKWTDREVVDGNLTRTATLLGTPNYLPPEWAAGLARSATTAGDVYGLGAILYFLLTGQAPHSHDHLAGLLREIADRPPLAPRETNPAVPRDLELICLKALAKEPTGRYHTAGDFSRDLRLWLGGRSILARPATFWEKTRRWTRRNPLSASLTLALFIVIATGGLTLARAFQVSRDRLHMALISQVSAWRQTGRLHSRAEALEALSRAASVKSTPETRDEMISALAIPEIRTLRSTRYTAVPRLRGIASDDHSRSTRLSKSGALSVLELGSGKRISELPSELRFGPPAEGSRSRPDFGPFSPDGRYLVIRDAGFTFLRLWDCDESRWMPTRVPGAGAVFTPDAREFAAAVQPADGKQGEIQIRHTVTGQLRASFPFGVTPAFLFPYSPDGERLLLAIGQSVVIMNTRDGSLTPTPEMRDTASPLCAAWLPGGTTFCMGTEDGGIHLVSPATGEVIRPFPKSNRPVRAIAVEPESGWIITQGSDGTTRVWNPASGLCIHQMPFTGGFLSASATGGMLLVDNGETGELMELKIVQPEICHQAPLPGQPKDMRGARSGWTVNFSPDGGLLCLGDVDGLQIYDPADAKWHDSLGSSRTWSMTWSLDGSSFFTSGQEGLLRWPVHRAGSEYSFLPGPSSLFEAGVRQHIALSKDGRTLALAAGDRARIYDAFSGMPRIDLRDPEAATPGNLPRVNRVSLNHDGRLAVGSRMGKAGVPVWDTVTGKLRTVLSGGLDPTPTMLDATSVLFSGNGANLYLGERNGLVCRDATTLQIRWSIARHVPLTDPMHVAESADGRFLAAVIDPPAIDLLDPASGRRLARLVHPLPCTPGAIALSADGSRLAAHCMGNVLQIWQLRPIRKALAQHGLDWEAPVFSPAAPPRRWRVRPGESFLN